MATRRIKEITNTATTFASDDFIALDGTSQGTRKMDKDDLIAEVSAGVSGDYLEEANNLSDVASLDTSKLNMEIPDVGTAPNEVPLSGQLGTMAFQDASGVSVANLEITDKIDLSGAPTQQLEVYGDAPTVRVTDTSDGVGDGDSIGKLEFYGSDGSSGGVGVRAKIDTVSETAAGNQYGVAISTSTANSAPVERVRVDGAGRVGIGGSPSELLHLTNATAGAGVDANIRFSPTTSTTRYAEIQAVNSDGNNNIDLRFFTAPAGTPVERLRIDSQGRLGVNNTSPGTNANANADDLVVGNGGEHGITIYSGSANNGRLFFSDGTGTDSYRGIIRYDHGSNAMVFGTNSSDRWTINSTGNLVAGANLGIDFGSTNTNTGVTVTGSVMSEYEQGTFSPKLADAATGGNEATIGTVGADYIRVGNQVFFAMRLIDINTTGLTSGNTIYITDMPYVCKSGSSFVPFNVMADTLTFGGQLVGVIQGGVGYANLRQFSNGAGDSAVPVSAISSGATDLFISGSYFVA